VINKVKSNSNSAHIFNVNINVNKLNSNSKLFSQVLELIIENSIKFSNPNSNIDITSISTNNEINIVIEDEGFGIPENEIDFIFDPFFVGSKSNSIKSGTGLGLSIVKENLSLLNGEIKIESEENKGTKVTLVLNNKS
jgi:signal transduction histidine kinase